MGPDSYYSKCNVQYITRDSLISTFQHKLDFASLSNYY